MQNNYTMTNEMPKVIDRIYVGQMGTGFTRKIHCEHKIEVRVQGTQKKLVLTFCSHTHKHRYLKAHPELLDYIDFGISRKDLNKHPEWKRYIEKEI